MKVRNGMPARTALLGAALAASMSAPVAQTASAPRHLDVVWGLPAYCPAVLDDLNRNLGEPRAEDLFAVARQFETGECVVRNELRATQLYGQAARRGHPAGARRLAALYGTGRGVAQSYANAGAWLVGKGDTDETIEPWDYSVGRVYTLVATVLDRMSFPRDAWPGGLELTLAVESDTQIPGTVRWRFVGDVPAQAEALRGPLAARFDAAVAQAVTQLAPTDPEYIVAARVTLPFTVRRAVEDRFVVTEQDPLLR